MHDNIIAQVTALRKMKIEELKQRWREVYDTEPPPFNKDYLVQRLTYRLQEIAYGMNSNTVTKRLEKLEKEQRRHSHLPKSYTPTAGMTLIREYQGVEHHVTVLADGFSYQGQKFRSLSQIARHITGTRWNGLVFFGIKRSGGKAA